MSGSRCGLATRSTLFSSRIDGPVEAARPFDGEAVAGAEVHGRIDNQRENIDAFERVLKLVHHLAAEHVFGLVDSGRIDEDDLRVVAIQIP